MNVIDTEMQEKYGWPIVNFEYMSRIWASTFSETDRVTISAGDTAFVLYRTEDNYVVEDVDTGDEVACVLGKNPRGRIIMSPSSPHDLEAVVDAISWLV